MDRLSAWHQSWSDQLTTLWRARRLFTLAAGQGLVEYALVLAIIAVLVIGAAWYLGGRVSATFSNVGTQIGVPATPRPTTTPKPTKTAKPAKTPRPTKLPRATKPPKP